MKFLITGAKGQLASDFPAALKDFNHEVLALDREGLDIADPDGDMKTVSQYQPHVVLNCAAYNLVDKAEERTRRRLQSQCGRCKEFGRSVQKKQYTPCKLRQRLCF